jgi:hypothetical protein
MNRSGIFDQLSDYNVFKNDPASRSLQSDGHTLPYMAR